MKLSIKLALLMVTISTLAIALVALINYYSFRNMLEEIQAHMDDLASVLAVDIIQTDIYPHTREQQFHLQSFVSKLERDHQLDMISVVDSQSKVISSSDPDIIGQHFNPELGHSEIYDLSSDKSLFIRETIGRPGADKEKLDIVIPIIKDNRTIGIMHIVMHYSKLTNIHRQIEKIKFGVYSGIWILAILIITFTAIRFTRPIRNLILKAEEVEQGHLTPLLPDDYQGELKKLALAFNSMIESLKEKQLLSERLHRVRKLATAGELARGLAHEIRNPLNSIGLACDYLNNSAEDDELRPEILSNIRLEVNRLETLVSQFMELAKPKTRSLQLVELNEIVMELVCGTINEQARQHGVDLSFLPWTEDLEVKIQVNQIRQLIINLCLNSFEAGATEVIIRLYSNSQIILEVADNGPGVSEKLKERIFEPDYTTKTQGMGLGLSICQKYAEENSGTLSVYINDSGGATFKLELLRYPRHEMWS